MDHWDKDRSRSRSRWAALSSVELDSHSFVEAVEEEVGGMKSRQRVRGPHRSPLG